MDCTVYIVAENGAELTWGLEEPPGWDTLSTIFQAFVSKVASNLHVARHRIGERLEISS
jgi:hypothetical protein